MKAVAVEKTFWVTNFSNKNVSLGDLYISIAAGTSVNLLDKRRYNFTEEQLVKSAENGSIFKKKHLIAVRKVPPQMIPKSKITIDPHAIMPIRSTSIFKIEQEVYEELNVEAFINEVLPEKENKK